MYFQAMHTCKNYEAKVNQPMSMEQKKTEADIFSDIFLKKIGIM